MIDESLIDIVECWDEFSWIDRKLIWLKCVKQKHRISSKELISLATLVSILGVLIRERHPYHLAGLLTIIVLSYFYLMFFDYLFNRGKIA